MKPNPDSVTEEMSIRPAARDAACRAIVEVLERRGFVSETLQRMQVRGLRGRDAGLAAEIALGSVRHFITLEHVLGRVSTYQPRHASPKLRAVLASAAYQLIWLDRVPEFAAVDEAVSLARRLCGGGPSRMANAILRKLARAIEQRRTDWTPLAARHIRVSWNQACAFAIPALPEPDESPHIVHLAAATGERPRRFQQLVEFFDAEAAAHVSWASQATPPVVLQPNTLRLDAVQAATRLHESFGPQAAVDEQGRGFLSGHGSVSEMPLIKEGLFFVQDATANACAAAVPLTPGMRVLDLCAAPGGKSLALALRLRDTAEIIACDTDPRRLAWLNENATRLGLHCVHAKQIRADDPLNVLGEFDVALVDAPCSNTGVIARRPEARLSLTEEKMASLVELQLKLLTKAATVVRRGGALVYSTCSIEGRENAELVRSFLAANANWTLASESLMLPTWSDKPTDWRDGGFVAVLRKS